MKIVDKVREPKDIRRPEPQLSSVRFHYDNFEITYNVKLNLFTHGYKSICTKQESVREHIICKPREPPLDYRVYQNHSSEITFRLL